MLPTDKQTSQRDLLEEIKKLKSEKNAIILAHFYQEPDIQDIADVCGDSFALARAAQKTDAGLIVFCGVHFMAETACILNPDKIVVIPDAEAGCSLADTCPPDDFRKFREKHPDHTVVTYINSSAEVKAMSDWICTSSNAQKVIQAIPEEKPVLFAPDINLGRYLSRVSKRKMVLWEGICIVHDAFSEQELLRLKMENPKARVLAHPECRESVLRHADFIGSTTAIISEGAACPEESLIIATEPGVLHQLKKKVPEKNLIPLPTMEESCACSECHYMRMNTLEKLRNCMRDLKPRIRVPQELAEKARIPLERMLSIE